METAEAPPPPPTTKAPVPSLLISAVGKSCERALEGGTSSSANSTEAKRGGGTRGGGSSLEAESGHGHQVRPGLDMRWELEVRALRWRACSKPLPACVPETRCCYWCPAGRGRGPGEPSGLLWNCVMK